jgi:hypothetical protein
MPLDWVKSSNPLCRRFGVTLRIETLPQKISKAWYQCWILCSKALGNKTHRSSFYFSLTGSMKRLRQRRSSRRQLSLQITPFTRTCIHLQWIIGLKSCLEIGLWFTLHLQVNSLPLFNVSSVREQVLILNLFSTSHSHSQNLKSQLSPLHYLESLNLSKWSWRCVMTSNLEGNSCRLMRCLNSTRQIDLRGQGWSMRTQDLSLSRSEWTRKTQSLNWFSWSRTIPK